MEEFIREICMELNIPVPKISHDTSLENREGILSWDVFSFYVWTLKKLRIIGANHIWQYPFNLQ